jgi:hypothetical protein
MFATKSYPFPNGTVVNVQGYEPYCLDQLLREGVNEVDLLAGYAARPIIWYEVEGTKHRYYPDIYIPSQNAIIEVKSEYTYKLHPGINHLKMAACISSGYHAELRIYSAKGELLQTLTEFRSILHEGCHSSEDGCARSDEPDAGALPPQEAPQGATST